MTMRSTHKHKSCLDFEVDPYENNRFAYGPNVDMQTRMYPALVLLFAFVFRIKD